MPIDAARMITQSGSEEQNSRAMVSHEECDFRDLTVFRSRHNFSHQENQTQSYGRIRLRLMDRI